MGKGRFKSTKGREIHRLVVYRNRSGGWSLLKNNNGPACLMMILYVWWMDMNSLLHTCICQVSWRAIIMYIVCYKYVVVRNVLLSDRVCTWRWCFADLSYHGWQPHVFMYIHDTTLSKQGLLLINTFIHTYVVDTIYDYLTLIDYSRSYLKVS